MVTWRVRLSQPSAGHATVAVISSHFEEWLERRHGVLTFRLKQVLTGHGCFERFMFRIRREETPGCHHCAEVSPAWTKHRRVLTAAIGGGDLSRPALVQVMVRSESAWESVTFFCEAVMPAKEEAERVREKRFLRLHAPSRRRRRPGRRESRADFRPP